MMTKADGRRRGLVLILIATGVAGVCGYAIQLLAPALLHEPATYVTFSVFWSMLYLFVGAIGGVQQEVTRAVHPDDGPGETSTLRSFVWSAAVILVIVAVIVGVVLAPSALASAPVALTVSFGVGLVGYLGVAILSGIFYGLSLWGFIALLTIVDAVVRAIFVTSGLLANAPVAVLAAFIAAPFTVALVVVWLASRRRVIGRFRLDVGTRRLSVNVLSTVFAAAATGLLVTGLPLLLQLSMPDAPVATIASLIAVITISRAPLIVPLMALQSFLIVDFRSSEFAIWPRLVRYLGLMAAATAAACALAWLFGPWVLDVISSGRYQVASGSIALIVASAGFVGTLCITGSALLSEGRHLMFLMGWVAAAVTTVLCLQVPLEPVPRVLTALLAGPVVGLAIHLSGVRPGARTIIVQSIDSPGDSH